MFDQFDCGRRTSKRASLFTESQPWRITELAPVATGKGAVARHVVVQHAAAVGGIPPLERPVRHLWPWVESCKIIWSLSPLCIVVLYIKQTRGVKITSLHLRYATWPARKISTSPADIGTCATWQGGWIRCTWSRGVDYKQYVVL